MGKGDKIVLSRGRSNGQEGPQADEGRERGVQWTQKYWLCALRLMKKMRVRRSWEIWASVERTLKRRESMRGEEGGMGLGAEFCVGVDRMGVSKYDVAQSVTLLSCCWICRDILAMIQ
jgi:hypothetical protein